MSSEGSAAIEKDRKGDDHGSENNRYDHDERVQGIRFRPRNFVPHDVVACVLRRLPAKSIGRFRCVCRQWRSLTHDARFVDEHRRLAGASGSARIVASDIIRGKTKIERLSIYEVGPNCDEIKHRFVHIDEPAGADFYSLSNHAGGLISVIGMLKSDISLLNPITREISQLPRQCNMGKGWSGFGLGFDASTGAYKMVTFHRNVGDSGMSDSCMVLTVGTEAWRHVGDAPCQAFSRPFFLHGTIYWLADAFGHICTLAFDVKHETFQLIPAPEILTPDILTPDGPDHNSRYSLRLHNLEGHICVVEVSPSASAVRIWMLTDSHEWEPRYEIEVLGKVVTEVLGILYGQVLIRSHDAVYTYDLHGKTLPMVCCGDFLLGLDVITDVSLVLGLLTESLVSPRDLIGMKSM